MPRKPLLALTAPAKLNLLLRVGPRTANGLHEIVSVMAPLALADELSFEANPAGFGVNCDDRSIAERENLAWRAAVALGTRLPPVLIKIRKQIPLEAGLGGGSADAAAALRGLAELGREQGAPVADTAIAAAAVTTGSDVSAALVPGLKVVAGTGETIRRVTASLAPWPVLLLQPAVRMQTARAYQLLDEARARRNEEHPLRDADAQAASLCERMAAHDFDAVMVRVANDFEGVIFASEPEIGRAASRLTAAGAAHTLLCGSGSCVAGFFSSLPEAQEAKSRLNLQQGEWCALTRVSDG